MSCGRTGVGSRLSGDLSHPLYITSDVYVVEWNPEAAEDLLVKVSRGVARTLVEVAKTALDDHYPPDGGTYLPFYWRRGITPECRKMLEEQPDAVPDTGENAWDYVLYYKRVPGVGRKYEVLRVVGNAECFSAFVEQYLT